MWSMAFLRGKAPARLRVMLWTSSTRRAHGLRNMHDHSPEKWFGGSMMCSSGTVTLTWMGWRDTLGHRKPHYPKADVISCMHE